LGKFIKIALILLSIIALLLMNKYADYFGKLYANHQYKNLENEIVSFNKEIARLDINAFDERDPSLIFKGFLKKDYHHVFIKKVDKWIYWSTISINPKIPTDACDSFERLLKSPTGYDFTNFKSNFNYQFYFIKHLKSEIENTEQNDAVAPIAAYQNWSFSQRPLSNFVNYFSLTNEFILSAKAPFRGGLKFWWLELILLLFITYLIFSLLNKQNSFGLSLSIAVLITLILFRLLLLMNLCFFDFQDFGLFSATLYASSNLLPSLGDLLINSLILMLITFLILHKKNLWIAENSNKNWFFGGIILFLNCIVFFYINSLFQDSQISFNFNQLGSINIYSFIGICIVLVWFITLHLLNSTLFNKFKFSWIEILAALLLLLLLGQISSIGLSIYLVLGLIFYLFYFLFYYFTSRYHIKNTILVEFVCFSILVAFINQKDSNLKEQDARKFFLDEILVESKIEVENYLYSVENSIADDTLILLNLDKSLLVNYTSFKNRVKLLYFNNLIKDYEVELLAFNNSGKASFGFEQSSSFNNLNELYNQLPFHPVLNYFKPINDANFPIDYISKYEGCDASGETGVLFIILKHKLFSTADKKSSFGSLIQPKTVGYNYNYSIYDKKDLSLSKRLGMYDYPMKLPSNWQNLSDLFFNENGFNHYIYASGYKNTIAIVSKKNSGFGNLVTNFSFFTLISILCAIIMVFCLILCAAIFKIFFKNKAAKDVNRYMQNWLPFFRYDKLFLSRRIQLNLVIVVSVAFLVTLIIVLRFVQNDVNERLSNEHFNKVETIINKIEGISFKDILLENQRNGFLLSLADEQMNDILLYGPYGQLYFSTAKNISNGKYIAPFVPFNSLIKLRNSTNNTLKEITNLGGQNFYTYYYSFSDNKGGFLGAIAIPNYKTNILLNEGTSNLVKTLVNLYAILLILGTTLVYFIAQNIAKPLTLLRTRLSELSLSGSNKTIVWDGKDEIAQLVHQYNISVKELSKSTELLAETEREGAWKEMAKQVAHEIKNPLTPMKLNLQHLQITMRRNEEGMKEKTQKIIEVLLAQIDKLTKLADDFGSFARISEISPVNVNPFSIISQIVLLFDKSDESEIINESMDYPNLIFIDQVAFERVLNNIIKNAIQSIDKPHGIITIKNNIKGKYYEIFITDNGKGIDPKLGNKVFSPNFSTKTSGMGIGLAICKKIIENANGKINFKSELNHGTTFILSLPIVDNFKNAEA